MPIDKVFGSAMKGIYTMSQPLSEEGKAQGFFKRQVLTRVATFSCVPLELAAMAEKILTVPIRASGLALKTIVKPVAYITQAECLQNLDRKLGTVKDFFITLGKIIGYAVGAFLTLTFGVIVSPSKNAKLHAELGLAEKLRKFLEMTQKEEISSRNIIEEINTEANQSTEVSHSEVEGEEKNEDNSTPVAGNNAPIVLPYPAQDNVAIITDETPGNIAVAEDSVGIDAPKTDQVGAPVVEKEKETVEETLVAPVVNTVNDETTTVPVLEDPENDTDVIREVVDAATNSNAAATKPKSFLQATYDYWFPKRA